MTQPGKICRWRGSRGAVNDGLSFNDDTDICGKTLLFDDHGAACPDGHRFCYCNCGLDQYGEKCYGVKVCRCSGEEQKT